MQTIEYRTVDKSTWARGAWDSEPDKVQWQDDKTGLPCLAVRAHTTGAWCGYVGVPRGHPAYHTYYDEVDAKVHGGLTFSGPCQKKMGEDKGICHMPEAGETDDVWWLGFDCAHAFDKSPAMEALIRSLPNPPDMDHHNYDVYRDLAYVRVQVRALAKQLKAMK